MKKLFCKITFVFLTIFILCLLYMGMFYLITENGAGSLPTSLNIPIDITEYLKIINGLHFNFAILFMVFIAIYIGVYFYYFLKYKSNINRLLFMISSCIFVIVWILFCIHKSGFIVMPELTTILLVQLLSIIFFKNMLIVCFLFWICVIFPIISLLKNNYK